MHTLIPASHSQPAFSQSASSFCASHPWAGVGVGVGVGDGPGAGPGAFLAHLAVAGENVTFPNTRGLGLLRVQVRPKLRRWEAFGIVSE